MKKIFLSLILLFLVSCSDNPKTISCNSNQAKALALQTLDDELLYKTAGILSKNIKILGLDITQKKQDICTANLHIKNFDQKYIKKVSYHVILTDDEKFFIEFI